VRAGSNNHGEISPRRRRRSVVAALVVALIGFAGCGKPPEPSGSQQKPSSPAKVTLGRPRVEPVQREVYVVGTLYGDQEVTLSAKVPGRIASIQSDLGDRVDPGQIVAQIEKRDYELAVNEKELAMREALAKLGLKEFPPAGFDAAQVPMVRRAALTAANAEAKLARGKQLHEQQPPLLSDQDYADLQTAAAVARSTFDVEMLNAQATLAESRARQAELELARQRLADATIRSPQPLNTPPSPATSPANPIRDDLYGVVERLISVGEYVREGTALFRLVDDDPVKLRATTSEQHVSQIKVGQKVRLTVEAYPDEFWGQVARVNPQVDQASRAFQFEVIVANPNRLLKPGGFAKAWVRTQIDAKAMFVPQKAIVSFAGVSKVFAVRDGKAIEILVETGPRRGDQIEIVSGLKGDERIVVGGPGRIVGGQAVEVSGGPEQ
jgi:multidrug efflux pump subunit AcrA (membrane-fusion protein)